MPSSTAPPSPHTRTVDMTVPVGTPPGAHTLVATVFYNGLTSTKNATFTLTAATNVTGPPVTVIQAYTLNTSFFVQTTFLPGDTVLLTMDRTNSLSTQVNVIAEYTAAGPSFYVLVDATISSSSTSPGLSAHYIAVPIPATAPPGTYTFVATVTYNGASSSQTGTFTVGSKSP